MLPKKMSARSVLRLSGLRLLHELMGTSIYVAWISRLAKSGECRRNMPQIPCRLLP